MALWHVGQTKGLESFDDDDTVAGVGCRLFYPQAIDEVLNAFPWPFATKFDSPALVQGPSPAPTPEWAYSYRYPSDALLIRRILPAGAQAPPSLPGYPLVPPWQGSRIETQASRVPYRIARDDAGLLLYTDFPPVAATATTPALPMIEYIIQQDDTGFYTPKFSQAVAFLVAFYVAPGLTGGDKFQLGQRAYANYQTTMAEAQAQAKNEEQPDLPPDAEWIQMRS
jgi:hypothetical protein